MDAKSYLDTYYAPDILTRTEPGNMAQIAAQQDIDTQAIKGATDFTELQGDIKALVYVSEKSDFSTFVHESAHVARRTMTGELLQKAEKAFGVTDGKWTRSQEEKFAQGFEQYLKEGKAPNAELKSVFQKAAEFLTRIYKSLQELVHINDDIRAVYDELLGVKDGALQQADANAQKIAQRNRSSIKEFGQNYIDYYHKGIEAIEKVLQEKKGQVVGAFTRSDIGDIHVVWGNEKVGLQKIIAKHSHEFGIFGEGQQGIVSGISKIVTDGDLTNENGVYTITYEKDGKTFRVGLSKGWNGKGENQWIITAYEKKDGVGANKTLSTVAELNSSQIPEETTADTHTITQDTDAVNGETEQTIQEQAQKAYDTALEAVQQTKQLSTEELKDMLFQTEQTENRGALYFQTEADFYEESAQAINKEVLEHDVEKIIIGKDPNEFYSLIYSDSEQRALYDKALENAALKDKYMAYAKEHFQGNSYHNADTDTDIRVSRDILDEWQSKTKSREQILSMQALDKLIESAVQTNTTEDRENRIDIQKVKYFETGLSVGDKNYKVHLTARKVQDNTTKAYHYYLEDVSLEDIAIDQIKKEAALSPLAPFSERGNQPLLRGTEAALRIDASSNEVNVPLLHGSDTDTIAQQSEAVNGETEQTIQEQAQDAYDTAAEAAQQMRQLSDEELKDMLFQAEQTEKREALYFQTEADFYEESTQAINKEVLEHDVEKIIIGKDVNEFYSLIYSDSEQRALYDKAFREAISEELEEALQKDIKDEAVKNDTFIKMLSGNKEAVKEFLKQFIAAQSMNTQERLMSYDAYIAHGGRFGELAYEITQGKAFTENRYKKALGIIQEDVGTYRNMFARMNGYDALISMSKEEKAWTKAYSEAVFAGKVKDAEQQSSVL